MTCSWTDNLGHKCQSGSVVTATISQLPYITPAAVGHMPPPVMRVGYCEVHRLARLAQLGKVRVDMEVEARMLAAVDKTLDEQIKGVVDTAVASAQAPLVAGLGHLQTIMQEDFRRLGLIVSDLALRSEPKAPPARRRVRHARRK